ncbi:MAG: hypothetical protein GXP40_11430 [Chloroflexi bacterium]|nr:hypothetical protein [Chloroflexota bacterium]
MNKFSFWQKWLFFVGAYISVFGLFMAFFYESSLFDLLLNHPTNSVFWAAAEVPESAQLFQKFVYGVMGSMMVGWGLVVALVAKYPFREKEPWAWRGLVAMLLSWFLLDTSISIAYHVYSNAMLNSVFFVLIALPLFFTRHAFSEQPRPG